MPRRPPSKTIEFRGKKYLKSKLSRADLEFAQTWNYFVKVYCGKKLYVERIPYIKDGQTIRILEQKPICTADYQSVVCPRCGRDGNSSTERDLSVCKD